MILGTTDYALRYASHGWLVIPVTGKRPTGNAWQTVAGCEQPAVAKMFATTPHDGVGVLIGQRSGLIDFDIDSEQAGKTLLDLFGGEITKTPCFQSSRGKHYLFRWTDKLPQGSIKIVVDGLEIRLGNGEKGCQTVFPPSGERVWIIDPDDCELADIPAEVIDRIKARHLELNKPKRFEPIPQSYPGSMGEDRLNVPRWLAKHGRDIIGRTESADVTRFHIVCPNVERHTTENNMRDCCVTQDGAGKLGGSCFHASCGMRSWDDLKNAIGGLEYSDFHEIDSTPTPRFDPLDNPAQITAVTATDKDEEETTDEEPEQIDLDFPAECLRPPGLIGDFIDYTLSTAKYPQPEHTLAAGLSLMSLASGRRVTDSDGTRGNIMVVSLGPTRSGKEYPRAVIKTILETVGAVTWFEEKLASEASLYGFLKMAHAGLLINDEFGDWLALARSKAGPNTQPARILTAMTMLYSSANGRFKAPRYAENSKQVELNQPHLVFMGTSTAEVFWKHVTPEYLSGGLFGRVMLFENRGYVDPMPRAGRNHQLPESLLNEIKGWMKFSAVAGDLAWENPTPFIVPHSSDALERFEAHELNVAKKSKSESAIRAALWRGTAEITAKLALLFACSRSRNPLMITIKDVELAIKLSNWLTRRKVTLCDDHVAENAVEDASKRVYRIIKSVGSKGISLTGLTHKTRWLSRRDRTEIITDLILSKNIVETEIGTSTKPKRVFMAKVNAGIVAGSLKMDA